MIIIGVGFSTLTSLLSSALALFIRERLRGFDPPPKQTPFDWVGYCFYCIAILSVSCVLIMGQELDWYRSSTD